MKNLNAGTGLARMWKAISGAAITLTVAAAVALAPTAPAFAYKKVSYTGDVKTWHKEHFLGYGSTEAKAKADAEKDAKCFGRETHRAFGKAFRSSNPKWFGVTMTLYCSGDKRETGIN